MVNHRDGIDYAFLLKDNNKTKEFKQWIKETNTKIEKWKNEILDISKQLEIMEKGNKKAKIENEMECRRLGIEQRTRELNVEFMENFLVQINQ